MKQVLKKKLTIMIKVLIIDLIKTQDDIDYHY
jgi:hypothetical protein